MPQSKETRAIQHLLIQGFEIMPSYAAVATLLVDRQQLDNPARSWAAVFDNGSHTSVSRLPDSEPLKPLLEQAAVLSLAGQQHVVCIHQGASLVTELDSRGPVTTARARIENAVALGKAPPIERLEAFSDEAIAAEHSRRQRQLSNPTEEPVNGTQTQIDSGAAG